MRKYSCAMVIALLATAAAAGCGGDDEKSPSKADDEKPLSKAEYIKQGDAICKKGSDEFDKEIEKAFADLGGNEEPSEEQLTPFVEDTLKPYIEGQVSDLRDLPAPEGDEEKLDKIYEGVETALAKIEDDPKVLLAQGGDPFEEANKAARDYGFKECGE